MWENRALTKLMLSAFESGGAGVRTLCSVHSLPQLNLASNWGGGYVLVYLAYLALLNCYQTSPLTEIPRYQILLLLQWTRSGKTLFGQDLATMQIAEQSKKKEKIRWTAETGLCVKHHAFLWWSVLWDIYTLSLTSAWFASRVSRDKGLRLVLLWDLNCNAGVEHNIYIFMLACDVFENSLGAKHTCQCSSFLEFQNCTSCALFASLDLESVGQNFTWQENL